MINAEVLVHNHYTLGEAPYSWVGIWEAPSKALLESHPHAYNIAVSRTPPCCHYSCDHCGTAINVHYILRDATGANFCVGSTCIEKLNDTKLITAAKAAGLKRDRVRRAAKKQAEQEARQAAHIAESEAQRERNGGLTDKELVQQARQLKTKAAQDRNTEITAPIVASFGDSSFFHSLESSLRNGDKPYGRANSIIIECLAKKTCSIRSKEFGAALDAAEIQYNDIISQLVRA